MHIRILLSYYDSLCNMFGKFAVGVAQLVRASGCGPEGRRFEPAHSPFEIKANLFGSPFIVVNLYNQKVSKIC